MLNEKQVKTTLDLGLLLIDKAKQSGILPKDLILLLIKANSNSYFKQLIADVSNYSTWKLKKLVSKIDYRKDKISSSNELLNYILSKCANCGLEEELIETFSQVASKNLLNTDSFSPVKARKQQLPYIAVSLFTAFFLLLVSILIFLLKKRK